MERYGKKHLHKHFTNTKYGSIYLANTQIKKPLFYYGNYSKANIQTETVKFDEHSKHFCFCDRVSIEILLLEF